MVEDIPATLSEFIDEVPDSETALVVMNRTEPDPVLRLLERAFDTQSVSITERQLPEVAEDTVLLVEEGEVVATSTIARLKESFLLVNADRYRTGTHGLETAEMPDVLTGLDETEFLVRGFPESNKEKLLLVLISRFIEGRALQAGSGRFDVSFQRLSRLDDEYGTRKVYERLADTGVDTHVYGVRDAPVADSLDVTVHGGTAEEYRRSWFVVYRPETAGVEHIALVAVEVGPNEWRAMWTYDTARVARIGRYIRQNF